LYSVVDSVPLIPKSPGVAYYKLQEREQFTSIQQFEIVSRILGAIVALTMIDVNYLCVLEKKMRSYFCSKFQKARGASKLIQLKKLVHNSRVEQFKLNFG